MNPNDPVGNRPPYSRTPQNTEAPPPAGGPIYSTQGPQAAPYPYPYAVPAGSVPGAPPPAGGSVWPAAPMTIPAVPKTPYSATLADGLLALASLVMGFLFMRWGAWYAFEGWGVAVTAGLWLATLLVYARSKGFSPGLGGMFWLAVCLLTALSCALWPGAAWHPLRGLLVLFAALYGAAVVLRILAGGRTGDLLFFDVLNLLFILPFRNLGYAFAGLRTLGGEKGRKGFTKKLLPVLCGLALALIVLAVVLPMLARADSGHFGRLLDDFARWLGQVDFFTSEQMAKTFAQLVLGVPVAIWLCALLAGAAHKRHHQNISAGGVGKGLAALRFVPGATIMIVLALTSAAYALFIGCQLPYFFSALGGAVPAGYEIYSEYAREGFFELCRIAAINLGLMAVAAGLYKGKVRESKPLRALNILLSGLTLLILFTACSKMGLYISVYGLTPLRVMTCVFMAFLAGVCVAVICLQFFRFSIVRVGVVLGAVLLCALCLADTGGLIVRYNANRYLAGTLSNFDEQVLFQCGPSGAQAGLAVFDSYDRTHDQDARMRLYYVLHELQDQAGGRTGTAADNLAAARARSMELPEGEYDLNDCARLFYDHQYEMERG